ncbi:RuvB-like protein 1 [Nematocida sp. LUAm3]|nr:RuvB-like protein 1 [Nematocida sp. LUAm3]KAI5174046.1 RuvB-like protein 1 [Nematocida sp. LUAm2]KAI5177211.1 RuvB-like protein 1 [Nematocida sp. LUAm1]
MDKGLAHNHISGLGVDKSMNIVEGSGLFGMEKQRKAASLFVEMVNQKKISGKSLLLTGESGSGKSALAVAVSKELGSKIPFVKIAASEVYSAQVIKTELLHQAMRRSTCVRIREIKNVYEGEIWELNIEEKEDPLNNYRKSVSKVNVSLRGGKGTQRLVLSPALAKEIVKQRISVGDIVYIEEETEIIKKLGRSERFSSEFDLESTKYSPLPKGDIFTKKEILQEMNLHEIDLANAKSKDENSFFLLKATLSGNVEIPERIRETVNEKVDDLLRTGSAEVFPGVLFIDEAHLLDLECFAFLSQIMESSTSPILILATNRKYSVVRGDTSGTPLPFGIPEEFLSRLFTIQLPELNDDQIKLIVKEKSEAEKLSLTRESLDLLSSLAIKHSLRYAFSLLSLAAIFSSAEEMSEDVLRELSVIFKSTK